MDNLEDRIDLAKRHFNRREYEQYINPIIQLLQNSNKTIGILQLREPINKYINNCLVSIDETKEVLDSGEEVINVNDVKSILDAEKGSII